MAELIDKCALYEQMTEEYKKHYAGTGKGYDFTIAMQMVQNQPTTTEAEIRAKAIDEFAEKLKYEFNGNIFTDEEKFKYAKKEQEQICAQNMSWKRAIKYVDYFAEQLKGE